MIHHNLGLLHHHHQQQVVEEDAQDLQVMELRPRKKRVPKRFLDEEPPKKQVKKKPPKIFNKDIPIIPASMCTEFSF